MAEKKREDEVAPKAAETHKPSEHSPWPLVVAVGLLLLGAGFLSNYAVSVLGVAVLLVAVVGWLWEPWSS